MDANARVGSTNIAEMVPVQQIRVQTVAGDGEALVLFNPNLEGTLPHPVYMMGTMVMTDEQVETLRRQISVYSTICKQLVDMHKATLDATQSSLAGMVVGKHPPFDSLLTPTHKTQSARQRWTPTPNQLVYLENLFDQGAGTPNKQRIKEITSNLTKHGPISETNVYNWFQNRKARAKRKQHVVSPKDGESEFDTDNDSPRSKRIRFEREGQEYSNSGGRAETGGHSSDGGGQYDQKPTSIDQYDKHESVSSGHMHSHVDSKQTTPSFLRTGKLEHAYPKGGTLELSQLGLLSEPRLSEGASGSFGEPTLLLDSRVHNVRTDDAGMGYQGLHSVDSYRLTAGLVDGVGVLPMSSDGLHNLHQVVGMLNNGLGNNMMRMQAQI